MFNDSDSIHTDNEGYWETEVVEFDEKWSCIAHTNGFALAVTKAPSDEVWLRLKSTFKSGIASNNLADLQNSLTYFRDDVCKSEQIVALYDLRKNYTMGWCGCNLPKE